MWTVYFKVHDEQKCQYSLCLPPPPIPSPTVCLFTSFPAALALTQLRTTNKKSISKLPSKFCCEKGMLINCQYIIILGYQQHEY